MKIIGISGKIGSGKTSLTQHLLKHLDSTWVRIAYGDLLKIEVSSRFNFILEYCYDSRKNNCVPVPAITYTEKGAYDVPDFPYPTVRRLLQWWGTEVRRTEDPDYWVKAMREVLDRCRASKQHAGVIVDDVRFPNEAELIKEQGGLLVRLDTYPGWVCDQKAASHPSETALDDYTMWDYQLCPGYKELEAKGDWLLTEIQKEEKV